MQPSVALVNHLLAQAREGSSSAIEELLGVYRDHLRNLASHRLGCKLGGRVSPSDLVQETLLAAWRDFSSFRGAEAPQFSVWLRTILLRNISSAVASHVKTSKRNVRREYHSSHTAGSSIVDITLGLRGMDETPSKIVSTDEDKQVIKRLMENLPDEYRVVIQWRNLEGIQFKEIAERLGKSSGATRLVWLRAIRMLREMHESKVDP